MVSTRVRYTLPAAPPPNWSWTEPVSWAAVQVPAAPAASGEADGVALGEGLSGAEADGDGSGAVVVADAVESAVESAVDSMDGDSDGGPDAVGAVVAVSEVDAAGSPESDAPQPLTATSAPAAAMAAIQRLLPSSVVMGSP
ncbi:hypothetical protein [Arthrobacter sp. TMS2-4]